MPLNSLVPRRAQYQRAPLVYRRKQRIAVLEAVLEVGEGFAQLVDEPVEFAFLWRRARFDQHPRCIHDLGHLESHALVGRRGATWRVRTSAVSIAALSWSGATCGQISTDMVFDGLSLCLALGVGTHISGRRQWQWCACLDRRGRMPGDFGELQRDDDLWRASGWNRQAVDKPVGLPGLGAAPHQARRDLNLQLCMCFLQLESPT
jgi:hypothetical protein